MTFEETLGNEIRVIAKQIAGREKRIKETAETLNKEIGSGDISLTYIEVYAERIIEDCSEIKTLQAKKTILEDLAEEFLYRKEHTDLY